MNPRIRKNRFLPMNFTHVVRWLLLWAVLLVGAVTPAGPVMAQEESFASYWKLTFDFENSFNGNLHIDMGYDDGAGGVMAQALVSRDFVVACQRVGSVSLVSGAARFTGGYLACQLDVKRAMMESVAACQQVDAKCSIALDDNHLYPHLHMAAQVYSTTWGNTPLFYHQDARYTALVGTSSTQLATTLTNMGAIDSALAAPPPIINNWHTYRSAYDCNPCAMSFDISGASQVVPVGPDMQVSFYTPQSTIYIGYDPASGAVIPVNSAIGFLSIDPPNAGSGG